MKVTFDGGPGFNPTVMTTIFLLIRDTKAVAVAFMMEVASWSWFVESNSTIDIYVAVP